MSVPYALRIPSSQRLNLGLRTAIELWDSANFSGNRLPEARCPGSLLGKLQLSGFSQSQGSAQSFEHLLTLGFFQQIHREAFKPALHVPSP